MIDKGGVRVRARTTPSAGALYPFEVLVNVGDRGTYLYDVDASRISRLAGTAPVTASELARSAGLAVPADPPVQAVVALVARPWKAMIKYGQRGYLYTYLDIGHAASNIMLSARAAGLAPSVHLRFHRQRLSEAFGLAGSCREPQIVVALSDAGRAGAPGWLDSDLVPVWDEDLPVWLEAPGHDEVVNWSLLREVSSYYTPTVAPTPGASRSVLEPCVPQPCPQPVALPRSAPPGTAGEDFTGVALRRHSARGFLSKSIPYEQLAGLFDGLGEGLEVDCASGAGVGVRLLARHIDGLPGGAYAYSPDGHALYPLGPADAETAVPDDVAVTASCMGQASIGPAAALVHLHAAVRPLLHERGRVELAELHFHAAHAAQRLCLNAARQGLGITCVGGFDETRCAALVGLPEEQEVIYLLAVGVPDTTAYKLDRATVAYSHPGTW